jgi:membrane protease YdiL (CAAX protease family)
MGLRNLLANYAHWRISWKWYASVLLTRPLIWLTVVMGYTVFSQRTFAWHLTDPGFFFLYLLSQLLVVGVGEELGWSGYALPQLQAHYGFLKANLLLGIIWGLWHLPFFYTVGDSQYGASILFFVLKLTAFRYLFSLAYTQTSSLLLPGLFHVSFNVLTEQIPLSPNDPWAIGLSVIFTAILLLLVSQNGWLRSGHSSNETIAQIPTT